MERLHSDTRIIEQVMQGQGDAFAVLVERYLPMVRNVALAQTRNTEDADDVAQEALLKAYTSLGGLQKRQRFAPWLATITRNTALTLMRRKRRHTEYVQSERPKSVLEPDVAQRELYHRIRQHIDALEVPLRETVLLYYFAGLKLREIAEVDGITPNAAEKRLGRARAALGERMLEEMRPAEVETASKKQVTTLMGLVAIAPPPWKSVGLQTAPVASIVGGIVMAKKVSLGIALVCALLLALWGLSGDSASTDETFTALSPADVNSKNNALAPQGASTENKETAVAVGDKHKSEGETDVKRDSESARLEAVEEAPSSAPEEAGGEIHGFIRDADTEEGVAGVLVEATRKVEDEKEQYHSDPSDDSGAFVITGIPDGDYKVEQEGAEGYQNDHYKRDIRAATIEGANAITEMVFLIKKGATLAGRVVDERGKGVAHARIHYGGGTGTYFSNKGESDGEGYFAFTGLVPTGDIWMHAKAEGLAHRMRGPLALEGEGLLDLTLSMKREAVVSGVLVDGEGTSIPRYTIFLEPDFQSRMGGLSAKTNEAGEFTIGNVFEGDFKILVNPTDKGFIHPNRRVVDTLHVYPGKVMNGLRVVYDVVADLVISGRVTDTFGEAMPGENVYYIPSESNSSSEHVQTDGEGNYRIEGLTEGDYNVRVSRGYRPGMSHTMAQRDNIPAGSENIDFVCTRYTTIRGRVLQANNGTPLTRFEIGRSNGEEVDLERAFSKFSYPQQIDDAEGRFELDVVPPGTNHVVVRAAGFAGSVEMVEVEEGVAVEGVEIRLSPCGPLRGRVVDEAGAPIPNAEVYLGRIRYWQNSPFEPIARSDQDGRFELASPIEGVHVLAAVQEAYAFGEFTVEVPSDKEVEIILPWGGVIQGTVLLNGEPALGSANLRFEESGHTDYRMNAAIDDAGHYEIDLVPPGERKLSVCIKVGTETRLCQTQSVFVASEETSTLDFDFQTGAASVSGEIRSTVEGWRYGGIRLLPAAETEEHVYAASLIEKAGRFELGGLAAGLYQIEAEATVQQTEQSLRYSGEVLVPEGGQALHDIELIPESQKNP
jgi:RNA polymerase sigma factor (sigma-70 family)